MSTHLLQYYFVARAVNKAPGATAYGNPELSRGNSVTLDACASGRITLERQPVLLGENHPLARTLGAFANDPMWDLVMEEIRKIRAAEDADPTR